MADSRSAAAWATARRQLGLVTRGQLLALGYGRRAIQHRLASGRLHPVAQGVYAVGWAPPSRKRLWMTAVLVCGHGAPSDGERAAVCLSHRSAGALWDISVEVDSRVDVTLRSDRRPRRAWIRARCRPSLPLTEIVERELFPVTSPTRTLLDLAGELSPPALERAVNDADKRDLVDPETLRTSLGRYPGQPGVVALRHLLDRDTFLISDSDLEALFHPIAIAAELPLPLSKQWVNGFEVDFHWPALGLVVETDGLRYHRTASAQARDRLRDQAHIASGLTVLRFTHRQVKYEAAYVAKILAHAAARL